jgi:hypothetical protein
VNIQKRTEFASQTLNRDTWPDENVRAIVGFRFLLWQEEFETSPGTQYLSMYPSSTFPIVDIIHPTTGALPQRVEGHQSPEQMVEHMTRCIIEDEGILRSRRLQDQGRVRNGD